MRVVDPNMLLSAAISDGISRRVVQRDGLEFIRFEITRCDLVD